MQTQQLNYGYGGNEGGRERDGPPSASLSALGPVQRLARSRLNAVAAVVARSRPHAAGGAAICSWYDPTISSKMSASASWMSEAPASISVAGRRRRRCRHPRRRRCRRRRHRCHRRPRQRCCRHRHRHHRHHRRLCRRRCCPHRLCFRSRHRDCTAVLPAIAPPPLWPITIVPPQSPSPIVTPTVAHRRHRCSSRSFRHPAIHCAVPSVAHRNFGWL
jgi:hypothetical protein